MKIILASSNKGKIEEFKKLLPNYEIIPSSDILGNIEIIEDKDTFKENAIKKASVINALIKEKGYKNFIVISDDSGISVPALNNEPGIYSARYAGENSSDKENNEKLIQNLNKNNLKETKAFYTACIALVYNDEVYTVHGWMHGKVINKQIGTNGFGYDCMFIPNGFETTLGELEYEVKKKFSHRTKALNLLLKIIDVII